MTTPSTHAKVYADIGLVQSVSLAEGLPTFNVPPNLTPIDMPNGSSTGQVANAFTDHRTIAASGSENLDLAGVLLDAFGNTLTFAVVKAILIIADAGNTNSVVVGGAASNTFNGPFNASTDTVTLGPGDVFLCTSHVGWTVTPSTGDLLKIANSGAGTSVSYTVKIVG